jgi:hypothetical protein
MGKGFGLFGVGQLLCSSAGGCLVWGLVVGTLQIKCALPLLRAGDHLSVSPSTYDDEMAAC